MAKIVVEGNTYEVEGVAVYKIKKDGSRGMQLSKGCSRWFAVINAAKAVA